MGTIKIMNRKGFVKCKNSDVFWNRLYGFLTEI